MAPMSPASWRSCPCEIHSPPPLTLGLAALDFLGSWGHQRTTETQINLLLEHSVGLGEACSSPAKETPLGEPSLITRGANSLLPAEPQLNTVAGVAQANQKNVAYYR